MNATSRIGILVCQGADRRLVEGFLDEMNAPCIAADRYDAIDPFHDDWEDIGLLIVDEFNAREFGDSILRMKHRDVAAYLPILVLTPDEVAVPALLERGFDDVVRTPTTHGEFRARLLAFMRLREASEQRFQTIFDSTQIGIFRIDPNGRLLMANPALLRMLGFNDLAEARLASRKDLRMLPVRTTSTYVGEAIWRTADGTSLPVLVRSSVTRDEARRPLYVEGTVEDLTERKAIESALRDHAARLTLALDAASMGDIDIHLASRTIDCAHMVYRLFGYEAEPPDRAFYHLVNRISPADWPILQEKLDVAIREGATLDAEFRVIWPDGSEHWLRARGEVMYDDRQKAERVVGVIRDATEEKRLQIDLITAKVEAEEMAALKSTFLANMSHEIRTPLTAIIGFASLLAGRVPPDQKSAVRRIQEGGQRLLETLNAVLTLARLESRQMDLVFEEVDVAREARGTLDMFEHQARAKGLELRFQKPRKTLRARLDRGAFTSIVQNLISNAIKFTEAGSVTVAVHGETREDGRDWVWTSVTDTGSGIDEAFLPLIFDEFKQESSGIRRMYEGAGLGLAIVKRLTDLLGGEVDVSSRKARGSRFRVGFPGQAPKPGTEPAVESEEAELPDDAGPRLLIVEDNEDTRRLLMELLSDRFEVELASDGDEALGIAESTEFDVVLMDINLGAGMSGVDVVTMLRGKERFADIPIIALTAYGLPGDRERFLSHGFTAHLPKPFNPDALITLIRRLKNA